MLNYTQFLTEVFGQPFPWSWSEKIPDEHYVAAFTTGKERYQVMIDNDYDKWELEFFRWDVSGADYGIAGTGEAFRVLATVIAIIKDFLKHEPLIAPRVGTVPNIYFTAKEPSRMKLYGKLIRMVSTELPGYEGINLKYGRYLIRKIGLHERFLME